MHIKDHSAAMKFFRTYDNVASKGKWKEFVDEMEFDSMLQEPRTMAQEPRIGLFMGGSEASQKGAIASSKKRKNTITEVSEELAEKIKNTKLKGTGVAIETTSGGGKVIRVRMNAAYPELDVFKIDSLPATEENLKNEQQDLHLLSVNLKSFLFFWAFP